MYVAKTVWNLIESYHDELLNYALKCRIDGKPIALDHMAAFELVAAAEDIILQDAKLGGKKIRAIKNYPAYLKGIIHNLGAFKNSNRSAPKDIPMAALLGKDGNHYFQAVPLVEKASSWRQAFRQLQADDDVHESGAENVGGYYVGRDQELYGMLPELTPLEILIMAEEAGQEQRRRKAGRRLVRTVLGGLPVETRPVLLLHYFGVVDFDVIKGKRLKWAEHITGNVRELVYVRARPDDDPLRPREIHKRLYSRGDVHWRRGGLTAMPVMSLVDVAKKLNITPEAARQLKKRGINTMRQNSDLCDFYGLRGKNGTTPSAPPAQAFFNKLDDILVTLEDIKFTLQEREQPRLRIVRSGSA